MRISPQHLISPSALPHAPGPSLSVLSYNVLLPNSVDGWWNYKMYNPPLQQPSQSHIFTWDHRRNLLKERLALTNSDVVCLQEVSPRSFEDDFSFMEELGYDQCEMFRKGRFRPATFWKSAKCELSDPPVHRDRTLLTSFKLKGDWGKDEMDERRWYVLNCHLQAGKQAKRRLRQIHDGVGAAVKLAKRLKEKHPQKPLLIVCGDFNGSSESAAVRLLEDGSVTPEFFEDGESVTSKPKNIPTASPLTDVPASVEHREAPPTLVVSELISVMVKDAEDAFARPSFSNEILDRLERIYGRFAGEGGEMTREDVERWLVVINGKVGRGTEFRNAAKEMGWEAPPPIDNEEGSEPGERVEIVLPVEGTLSFSGFCNVYLEELRQGKFWGIAHDLAVLGEPLEDAGVYTGRYDRMYCSEALRPFAVLDTVSSVACPNEFEPSDHLPVGATFCLN